MKQLVLALALLTAAGGAHAAPRSSLGSKTRCAQSAFEVSLRFERDPRSLELAANERKQGHPFPEALRQRALATARVTHVFFGAEPPQPGQLKIFLPDQVWWSAHDRGALRAVYLVAPFAGVLKVLYGQEGVPSDAEPGYDEVRAAVDQLGLWRQQPGAKRGFKEAEALLGTTKNDAVASLASAYLCEAKQQKAVARASKARGARLLCEPAPPCARWPVDASY